MKAARQALTEAFATVDARLADPNWHPTEQDIAAAWHALGHERAARQFELLGKEETDRGRDQRPRCVALSG